MSPIDPELQPHVASHNSTRNEKVPSTQEHTSDGEHVDSGTETQDVRDSDDSESVFDDTASDEQDKDEDDTPDPLYVADMLRQLGVDWIHHPEYATHRLIVVKNPVIGTDTSNEASAESVQCYRIMAQFLSPASAVFRDTLVALETGVWFERPRRQGQSEGQGQDRLACIQVLSETDASAFKFPELPLDRRPLPSGLILPPLIQATDDSSKDMDDTLLPVFKIYLPHPEHFPALLQVMYDLDLDRWEEACFRPWTIASITHNVRRLECSTDITLRCLEYYHRIKSDMPKSDHHLVTAPAKDDNDDMDASMSELKELYRLAVENGLLSTAEE